MCLILPVWPREWEVGGPAALEYWQSKHTGLRAHCLLCVHRVLGQAPRSCTSWRQRQQCHHLVTVNSVSALKSLAQYLQSQRSHIYSAILTWIHHLPGRAECPGLPAGLRGPWEVPGLRENVWGLGKRAHLVVVIIIVPTTQGVRLQERSQDLAACRFSCLRFPGHPPAGFAEKGTAK